jgi:hypothetical protein
MPNLKPTVDAAAPEPLTCCTAGAQQFYLPADLGKTSYE